MSKKDFFILQVWWPLGQVCHLRTRRTLSTCSTYLHLRSLPFKGFNTSLIDVILFITNETPQNIFLHRLVDALGISVPQKPRLSSNNEQKICTFQIHKSLSDLVMLVFVNNLLFITAFRNRNCRLRYIAFEWLLCCISCANIFQHLLVNIARSLCCLHRAKALVPYDEHGRRCSGEKMWLNLQVADLIFVTNIKNYIRAEKIVMWRNFSLPSMTNVGKLKTSPHVENF